MCELTITQTAAAKTAQCTNKEAVSRLSEVKAATF